MGRKRGGREPDDGGAVVLTLPLPPSVNNAYRTAKIDGKVRRVQRSGVRQYKTNVKTLALMQRARVLEGDLSLTVLAYFPDRRRRDLSNIIKVLEDSLVGVVMRDDVQVHHLEMHKLYDKGDPRVEVVVARVDDTEQREAA